MACQPTEEEKNEFIYITKMHKYLVKYLGKMFNNADYTNHDDSKFQEPELTPYILRFVSKAPKTENPNWTSAKNHHFSVNDHHVEYWKYYAKKDMPLDSLSEAVIDMMAANFQYTICKKVVEYARKNDDKYEFDTDKLNRKLHEFLKKPEMYFFEDRFLSEFNENQKKVINEQLQVHKETFNLKYHKEL